MSFSSIGDLAQHFQLRRHAANLKTSLARHGDEMVTGRIADPARKLRGQYAELAGIEFSLSRLGAFETARRESMIHTTAMQRHVTKMTQDSEVLAAQLVAVSEGATTAVIDTAAAAARATFDSAVANLNATAAGRALFAGIATTGPALAPAATIMDALSNAIGGLDSVNEIAGAVSDWFHEPGGGFETLAYLGSGTSSGPVAIGPNDDLTLTGSAASPEMRDYLAALAIGALSNDNTITDDPHLRRLLLRESGDALVKGHSGLISVSAGIGVAEARLDRVMTRNASEARALDLARQEILAADPYEAAIKLEETRARIEAMYQVTARLSRLNLGNHLR